MVFKKFRFVTLTRALAYFPWLPGIQIWRGDRAIGKVSSDWKFGKKITLPIALSLIKIENVKIITAWSGAFYKDIIIMSLRVLEF